jgi:hypothetical protein
MKLATRKNIDARLAEIQDLPTAELRQRWRKIFDRESEPKIKRELLIAALAHQLQVQAFGGVTSRTLRTLRARAQNQSAEAAVAAISQRLPAGTHLIREWQGQTHVVETSADGFLWRGDRYKSLSVIAREITGTQWSGPRFFGLYDRQSRS